MCLSGRHIERGLSENYDWLRKKECVLIFLRDICKEDWAK
jgi:hypothetical protein